MEKGSSLNLLEDLKRMVCELIDIYSPSGKEEALLKYLQDYLKEAGISFKKQPVDENRYNILIMPSQEQSKVVFVGHIDTVTALDFEDYKSSIKDDTIQGLGSVDMKSGCVAMLKAFIDHWKEHNQEIPAGLALVVGEEETGDGISKFLEEYSFKWAVVGEPTRLVPCFGHHGYLEIELNTYGKRRHASFAGREHNATYTMLSLLLRLSQYLDKRSDCVYNIRDLHSSESGFSVPDKCICWIDIHLHPDSLMQEISHDLETEAFDFFNRDSQAFRKSFSFDTFHYGYNLEEKGAFPEILKEVYKEEGITWKKGIFRSDSDANQLYAKGTRPIILGPGELAKAHTYEEAISFSQVVDAYKIYSCILKKLSTQKV